MEMPKPTADHQRLERLCGDWRGTETMHPSPWDPNGGQADGRTVAHLALGGFAVVVDYTQARGGATTFEGHGVYTWDAGAGEVVLHWFDSMGQGREEFRGTWNGDVLTLTSKSPHCLMRMTYDLSQAGRLASAMDTSQDGAQWSRLFDADYRTGG